MVAQQKIFVNSTNDIKNGTDITNVNEITFSDAQDIMFLKTADAKSTDFTIDKIKDITFEDADNVVKIVYNGSNVSITNPFACAGVTITKTGADVIVNSTTDAEVEYVLSGTTSDGSFKMYNAKKYILTLNGVSITNSDGPAINIQGSKKTTINLVSGTTNTLVDGATYSKVSGEDQKGTIFSEGKLSFNGEGALYVTGNYKHGIVCDDEIEVNSGNIYVTNTTSDAFHSKDAFNMNGGYLKLDAKGDAIDGDVGIINIKAGTIDINSTVDTSKGIKCDSTLTISGGKITMTLSGGVVVTSGDPSYSTAIKSDRRVNISGGDINIVHSGKAGKGISADGWINITGGNINIKTTGNGATYTNTSSVLDSYSATCITSDSTINVVDGSLILESTGTAGKCISSDIDVVIGNGTSNPSITAKTSGAKFLVSGSGMNADYANPKVIKADNNLTVNSGTLTLSSTADGGEGLESKNILTINNGLIEINTVDDAINAAKQIIINGGNIYCYSSGNDGIDSNGTLTINGGIVISSGTSSPEEGFDCDQNTFTITGGVLIGTGGSSSTPTNSVCTQRAVLYGGSSMTSGKIFRIEDASGTDLLTYKMPRAYNQYTLLFSSKDLASGKTYTIKTGGTVTGGTEFHGYVTNGTYSSGTQATTFTCTNMVTTVGTSGGGPGGGGGRP